MSISEEERKEKLKKLLNNPAVVRGIHKKMLQMFSGWALETPGTAKRVDEYVSQFKIVVEGVLKARGDEVDSREVLLALQILAEDFSRAIVLERGTLLEEEEVKEMEKRAAN